MDSQTFLQVTAYLTKRIIYEALKMHVHLVQGTAVVW